MKDVPNFWVIMDNGYVYFFMTFGVLAFVLFCAGYMVVIGRYSGIGKCFAPPEGRLPGKGKGAGQEGALTETAGQADFGERLPELAMIFSFLLYGIMEQFLSNAFMNFSLLFLGEVLFGRCGVKYEGGGRRAGGKEGKNVWKEMGTVGKLACGVFGLAVFAVYYLAVPVEEYVCVPVGTLNYVNAQSIWMDVAEDEVNGAAGNVLESEGKMGAGDNGEAGSLEDALQEKMKAYGQALEKPDILEAALYEMEVGERLSAAELAAALEYSIPVSLRGSEGNMTFRVRLLELYYDITGEEYRGLLEHMIAGVQREKARQYSVNGDIYGERIGKSAGDDRMEHMGKDKEYQVEKTGNIVKMEHFRDSVFAGVLGMTATMAVWGAMHRICRSGNQGMLKRRLGRKSLRQGR